MTYDDGGVACTEDALVIRRYYFPSGDKRIPYTKIERVRRAAMGGLTGKYRIWGSGDFVHWYNLDPGRPGKSVQFIVELPGARVSPVITPRDPDAVAAEFAAHGVNVTTG
jgi:hypothetical protein